MNVLASKCFEVPTLFGNKNTFLKHFFLIILDSNVERDFAPIFQLTQTLHVVFFGKIHFFPKNNKFRKNLKFTIFNAIL